MFWNHLSVAWRNLLKYKGYSFINIFGLAAGLTCCFLISLYLYNEYSYDSYHRNRDRIYQVGTGFIKQGVEETSANTPAPLAIALQNEFSEIEQATRIMRAFSDDKTLFQYRESDMKLKSFYEHSGFLADSNFFSVLDYHFIAGDSRTALSQPNTLVIEEEIAKKIFGNDNAIGKVLHVSSSTNGNYDFKITGVFRRHVKPTHIDARFFMSMNGGDMEQFIRRQTDLASNNMFHTYLLLKSGTNAANLEKKFPAFVDKYAGKDLRAVGFYKRQFLTRIDKIHLSPNTKENVTPVANVAYLKILASVAIFTLLIACINFMNLSTARSSRRSTEVGVRKVLGAERSLLIKQFLGESVLMAILAFFLSIALSQLLLPVFSKVTGSEFVFSFKEHATLLGLFFVLSVITGLIAGSYPAFYLSSFQPVRVLKGKFQNSFTAISLRKGLVVIQFVVSVVLIIASVVISNQMQFLRSKDLGFAKDQQIVIPLRSPTAKSIYPSMKEVLSTNSGIRSVGASYYYPGMMNPSDMMLYKKGKAVSDGKQTYMNYVDDNFLKTINLELIAGRLFSNQFPADTNMKLVINKQGIQDIGFKTAQEAVGQEVMFDWRGETYRFEIVGVVNNFHFKDLHSTIEPYAFQLATGNGYNYLVAHAPAANIKQVLATMEGIWTKLNPNEPFEYSFMDEDFAKNYAADNRFASLVKYFTILAIMISCLGLFGLAAFTAEQRMKEIAIRKVLGASLSGIVGLISINFLKLVLISIIIATPLAWYLMHNWLQDFAYREPITGWMFVIAGLIAIFIAFVTVSFQALKAGTANPVKNLRAE
jgi:putative ABC transport system permease protein